MVDISSLAIAQIVQQQRVDTSATTAKPDAPGCLSRFFRFRRGLGAAALFDRQGDSPVVREGRLGLRLGNLGRA